MKGKTYAITEYNSFSKEDVSNIWKDSSYEELEKLVRIQNTKNNPILQLVFEQNTEKIKAKQWAGILCLKTGDSLEILPKIVRGSNEKIEASRQVLLQMLSTINNPRFKQLNEAHYDAQNMPILDIFIRMFISETQIVINQGLRNGYETVEENLRINKGHLCLSEHIRKNAAHRERFFVRYDVYSSNRAENRLIKSTLLFLKGITTNIKNTADIISLLTFFDDIDESKNYESDFQKCSHDRNMQHYQRILEWCRIFLSSKSLYSKTGEFPAVEILYQMDHLFESYIAHLMKKNLGDVCKVISQDRRFSLFGDELCSLRPDIVLQEGSKCIILDTKWKLIDKASDISQGDMYQMFAYQKRYEKEIGECSEIHLLYPAIGACKDNDFPIFHIDNKATVKIDFLDLSQKNPIDQLCNDIHARI